MAAIEPEMPLPGNAFPAENSGIVESERIAAVVQTPIGPEEPGPVSAFPIENAGIVQQDRDTVRAFPMENSGITNNAGMG